MPARPSWIWSKVPARSASTRRPSGQEQPRVAAFTNDGDLTKQLTHPSYLKKKIYQVTLDKPGACRYGSHRRGHHARTAKSSPTKFPMSRRTNRRSASRYTPAATVSCAVFSNSWLHGHQARPGLLCRPDQEEPQARSLAFPLPRGGRTAQVRPVRISPCIRSLPGGIRGYNQNQEAPVEGASFCFLTAIIPAYPGGCGMSPHSCGMAAIRCARKTTAPARRGA